MAGVFFSLEFPAVKCSIVIGEGSLVDSITVVFGVYDDRQHIGE
jgi:hypothetical protein